MKIQNNPYKKAKKDSFNSTYIQEIQFENGKLITGYSATSGFAEKNDKMAVLINWILRMYKIGYLDPENPTKDPVMFIEYFLNLQSGKKPIFRLYYRFYEAFEGAQNYMPVITFLDLFFEDIEKKMSCEKIFVKHYRNGRSGIIDPMDHIVKRFFTLKSLQKYCRSAIERKVLSADQAFHFETKYIEHHNLQY